MLLTRFLCRFVAMCWLLSCTTAAYTATVKLKPPMVDITTTDGGKVRVAFQSAEGTTGFNVYKDTNYLLTVPYVPESGAFELAVGHGSYCIVAYAKSGQGTRFSRCSRSLFAGSDPQTDSPETTDLATNPAPDSSPPQAGQPDASAPQNLVAEVYSKTAAELFWDPLAPGQSASEHRVYRGGQLVGRTDGRSFFMTHLRAGERYLFSVTRVSLEGFESAGVQVAVRMRGSSVNANVEEKPVTALQLSLEDFSPELQEGGHELIVPLAVSGWSSVDSANADKPLELSLHAAIDGDLDHLDYRFEPATLSPGQSSGRLVLGLSVAMAPLLAHQRELRIAASNSAVSLQQTFSLSVEPVQAPDVYLLAGQSNMTGSSNVGVKDATPGGADETDPRIRQLNVVQNDWRIFNSPDAFTSHRVNIASPTFVVAEDPLHQPKARWREDKGGTRVGLGLSFAKAMLPYTSQQVLLVPAAWSGSGFCKAEGDPGWNAEVTTGSALGGTLLLERAISRLDIALRESGGVFRGILWHQGEADSNNEQCASAYQRNLQKLVARIRTETTIDRRGSAARGAEAKIPLVVGTMSKGGRFVDFGAVKGRVDSTHRLVAELVPWSGFVNSDDLVPPAYPCGSSSCVHFGATALREMGIRYAAVIRAIVSQ